MFKRGMDIDAALTADGIAFQHSGESQKLLAVEPAAKRVLERAPAQRVPALVVKEQLRDRLRVWLGEVELIVELDLQPVLSALGRPSPTGIIDAILLPMRLEFKTRAGYRRIVGRVREQLDEQAANSPVVRQHRDRLLELSSAFVKEHLRRVRRVATFAAYDRLFALWHKVHLPFFYLLIVTAIVHVVAVHAYSL